MLHSLRLLLQFLRLPVRLGLLWRKPLPYSLDHLVEPVEVQEAQSRVAKKVYANKPQRQFSITTVTRHPGTERGRVTAAFSVIKA